MAINREKIQPQGMHVRIMAGQPAYSQIVTVRAPGGRSLSPGNWPATQKAIASARGTCAPRSSRSARTSRPVSRRPATLADIVKTNTYVTDFEEFSKHGDVRMRYFGPATPTSTTVEVRRLAGPDFMIEIDAIAFVDN